MHLGGESCVTTVLLLDSKEFSFPGQHALKAAIRQYISVTNAEPKPFRWTKTADDILASMARFCQHFRDRTLGCHVFHQTTRARRRSMQPSMTPRAISAGGEA